MINRDYYLKQHKTVEYLGCYLYFLILAESQWPVEFLKRSTQN